MLLPGDMLSTVALSPKNLEPAVPQCDKIILTYGMPGMVCAAIVNCSQLGGAQCVVNVVQHTEAGRAVFLHSQSFVLMLPYIQPFGI